LAEVVEVIMAKTKQTEKGIDVNEAMDSINERLSEAGRKVKVNEIKEVFANRI